MGKKTAISFLLLLLLTQTALADVMVIIRREAEASGNYVRICDVARIEGPREQVTEVAGTVIGPTPPKGHSKEISRWDIENRLFEMGIATRVTFTGNNTVKVFGNGERQRLGTADTVELQPLAAMVLRGNSVGDGFAVDNAALAATAAKTAQGDAAKMATEKPSAPEAILAAMPENARNRVGLAISHYLASIYNKKRPDIEVETKVLSLSESIPYEAFEVEVVEAMDGQVPGKANLRLRVKETSQSEPRLVVASADTEVFGRAPVAAKQLFKGDVLNPNDVLITRVKMLSGQSYLPPNAKAAEGRSLKRNFNVGEPVLATETVETEAVKRGNIVKTFNEGRGFTIESNAKALADGMVGDVVKVEDIATKTRYDARVTGRNTVTVLKQDWRTK